MPISTEQQKKIKQTIKNYRESVKKILIEHREKVLGAANSFDTKKADNIRSRIKKN
ncbi:hypothetical protein IT408_04490 [Candidatus Uhrbacteria bacterium]|nr:hypothetical protein [Candidatus Uhrbacteria bacterium]